MKKLIYRGSAKDVYQSSRSSELVFSFTNRYSIFDWGEMPDHIPGKGVATAKLTSYLYQELEKNQIVKTHYVSEGSEPNEIVVRKFYVPPVENYVSFYESRPKEAFLPLEVLYRWGVPQGSSLLKRGNYTVGQRFDEPMIEFSTKLEPQDRLLTHQEAQKLASLTDSEFSRLVDVSKRIATFLKDLFKPTGIEFWDGKIEFAMETNFTGADRDFILVDSIGLDEVRLTRQGLNLSKEVLRQKYANSAWVADLNEAKKKSKDHFKDFCKQKPQSLDHKIIDDVSRLYALASSVICQQSDRMDELDLVLEDLKK